MRSTAAESFLRQVKALLTSPLALLNGPGTSEGHKFRPLQIGSGRICHWLRTGPYGASIACHAEQMISDLQYARRPKPPSLKEQALESLHHLEAGCLPNIDLLRRALEAMPNE